MAALGVRIRDSQLSITEMRDLVRLAEQQGYDSVWLPESIGREACTELTALVLVGERIRVGTGIVPVFARLPTVAAAAMATAATLAPGRVMLGLGIGHKGALQDGHGVQFSQPLQHVREFATIARRVFRDGQVSYSGEVYAIKHFQLDAPLPEPVPVYLAALRPQMLRLAGAVADGVLMNWATVEYIPQAIRYVQEGAEAAGRSLADIHIASYLRTCVTDRPDIVEQHSREQIARYGAMVYYRQYFASIGFTAEAEALERAWQRGDRATASDAVSAPMLRALTIYGSAAECRDRLRAYREAGLQLPIIAPFPVGEPIQETFRRTIAGCV